MKNQLEERAYMALLKTMSLPLPEVEGISEQPRNQWHAQLLAQAERPPISHRNWESQSKPVSPCRLYDWPENETN